MQFLRENKAVLNFGDEELMFCDQSVPFQEYHTVHLPARTKKLIDIPVMNSLAKDGYIGRIQAGPGVFLGESLVSQNGGYIKTFAINSNTHGIDLTLAPVELEPYYAVPPRARAAAIPNSTVEATKVEAKRQATRGFRPLNEEEKQSLLPILADYSPQLHLPGDALGSTSILSHKIVTTDERPIATKQYRPPPVHREEITKQVDDLIKKGLVQASESPYNSPL